MHSRRGPKASVLRVWKKTLAWKYGADEEEEE